MTATQTIHWRTAWLNDSPNTVQAASACEAVWTLTQEAGWVRPEPDNG
jgi:hypothetical protein